MREKRQFFSALTASALNQTLAVCVPQKKVESSFASPSAEKEKLPNRPKDWNGPGFEGAASDLRIKQAGMYLCILPEDGVHRPKQSGSGR